MALCATDATFHSNALIGLGSIRQGNGVNPPAPSKHQLQLPLTGRIYLYRLSSIASLLPLITGLIPVILTLCMLQSQLSNKRELIIHKGA